MTQHLKCKILKIIRFRFDEWLIEFFMASKFAQLLINDISKIIQQI